MLGSMTGRMKTVATHEFDWDVQIAFFPSGTVLRCVVASCSRLLLRQRLAALASGFLKLLSQKSTQLPVANAKTPFLC